MPISSPATVLHNGDSAVMRADDSESLKNVAVVAYPKQPRKTDIDKSDVSNDDSESPKNVAVDAYPEKVDFDSENLKNPNTVDKFDMLIPKTNLRKLIKAAIADSEAPRRTDIVDKYDISTPKTNLRGLIDAAVTNPGLGRRPNFVSGSNMPTTPGTNLRRPINAAIAYHSGPKGESIVDNSNVPNHPKMNGISGHPKNLAKREKKTVTLKLDGDKAETELKRRHLLFNNLSQTEKANTLSLNNTNATELESWLTNSDTFLLKREYQANDRLIKLHKGQIERLSAGRQVNITDKLKASGKRAEKLETAEWRKNDVILISFLVRYVVK